MGYQRTVPIDLPPGQSVFLWGARQTGKSTLLRERFPDSVHYDLLDADPLLRFTAMPSRLRTKLPREGYPGRFTAPHPNRTGFADLQP